MKDRKVSALGDRGKQNVENKGNVVPIVIGVLSAIYHLGDWMLLLRIDQKRLNNIQQTTLLGSANITGMVRYIQWFWINSSIDRYQHGYNYIAVKKQ